MKKLLVFFLLTMPCIAMAQSEWELPDAVKKEAKAAEKTAGTSTKDAVPAPQLKIDRKYAAGAVPEIDGKVEWDDTITVPGVCVDTLYNRALEAITAMTKAEGQYELSRVTAVNRSAHIIAACLDEEMVFTNHSFSKDFTEFKYTLIATCYDGKVILRLCRLTYIYEKGRSLESTYRAEELITDKEALNKKGTNFIPINGKFRRKTIDRKDEVFAYIESRLKS